LKRDPEEAHREDPDKTGCERKGDCGNKRNRRDRERVALKIEDDWE
jgi:hypothetical protein